VFACRIETRSRRAGRLVTSCNMYTEDCRPPVVEYREAEYRNHRRAQHHLIIMSQNPLNLVVRFLLEILALVALGAWAKAQFPGALGFALMILIPLLAATAWGIFNVKGDPSRSGKAPVPIPGVVRLLLELALFGSATWALFRLNPTYGWIFGAVTLVHYFLSYDRIVWLLKR
jgi:hypothetical protein